MRYVLIKKPDGTYAIGIEYWFRDANESRDCAVREIDPTELSMIDIDFAEINKVIQDYNNLLKGKSA